MMSNEIKDKLISMQVNDFFSFLEKLDNNEKDSIVSELFKYMYYEKYLFGKTLIECCEIIVKEQKELLKEVNNSDKDKNKQDLIKRIELNLHESKKVLKKLTKEKTKTCSSKTRLKVVLQKKQ